MTQDDSEDPLAARCQFEAKLIARAWEDPEFRRSLLADPRAAFEKELGRRLPAAFEIRVLEDTPVLYHFVIPRNPAGEGELADFELDNVVGG